MGVPPPWITTIFGAEVWAVLQVVTHSTAGAPLRIDCRSVVTLLAAGRDAAVSPRRLTASAWADIFTALQDAAPADFSWIPAHTAAADVGCRLLSNGFLLSDIDRVANAEADRLAKRAVEAHRVPKTIRDAIARQEDDVDAMARWLARITLAANSWGDAKARDSVDAPSRRRAERRQCKRARPPPEPLPPVLGGHTIVFAGAHAGRKWVCAVCHSSASTRMPFAARRCPGSSAAPWVRCTRSAAVRGKTVGRGHTLLLTGPHVWCFDCGATACARTVLLKKPCPGSMRGPQSKWRMQARQRLLLGLHPDHRMPLGHRTMPEPGQPWPAGYDAALKDALASRTSAASGPKRRRGAGVAASQPDQERGERRALPALAPMLARIRARAAAAAAQ